MKQWAYLGLFLFLCTCQCDAGEWIRFRICPDLEVNALTATGFKIADVFWVRSDKIRYVGKHLKHGECSLVGMDGDFQIFVKGHVQDIICKVLIGEKCPNPRVTPE